MRFNELPNFCIHINLGSRQIGMAHCLLKVKQIAAALSVVSGELPAKGVEGSVNSVDAQLVCEVIQISTEVVIEQWATVLVCEYKLMVVPL